MNKTILAFGLLIAALLILFRLGKYNALQGNISIELLVSVIAVVFFFIGIYFRKKQLNTSDKEVSNGLDHEKLKELNISPREHDVLVELVNGLSNKEIAVLRGISSESVKVAKNKLRRKLNLPQRADLSKFLNELA